MKTKFFTLIKGISIVLISSALGVELWNLSVYWTTHPTLDLPVWMVAFARFALISHLIEGLIAARSAPAKQKAAIPYGIYTFFVGTVALLELFDPTGIMIGDRSSESYGTSD